MWDPIIEGCTTSTACNYNPEASVDDNSCIDPLGCNNWCPDDTTEVKELDCAGVCDGNAVEDCAGVCGGHVFIDCTGQCGILVIDQCGLCGGNNATCTDCNGVINGEAYKDGCDTCIGGDSNVEPCLIDCAGTWGGDAQLDACGVCGGTNTDDSQCTECPIGKALGCDNSCYLSGTQPINDECNVCRGDNTVCADCLGIPNGNAELDICGICEGNGDSCFGCTDPNASNFDADAIISVNTCEYSSAYEYPDFETIYGMDEYGNPTEVIGDGIWGTCIGDTLLSETGGNSPEIDFLERDDDATSYYIIITDTSLHIVANGFIGGVQITLIHGDDFTIDMTERALHADYLTQGNETRLLVITPETDLIFTYTGEFEIVDIIVANSSGEIQLLPTVFSLNVAYPNPFNGTTSMSFTVPVEHFINIIIINEDIDTIITLVNDTMSTGTYNITWDATEFPDGYYRAIADFGDKQCFVNLHKSN